MGGKKKSGRKKSSVEKILLATAILNLLKAIAEIIHDLLE